MIFSVYTFNFCVHWYRSGKDESIELTRLYYSPRYPLNIFITISIYNILKEGWENIGI